MAVVAGAGADAVYLIIFGESRPSLRLALISTAFCAAACSRGMAAVAQLSILTPTRGWAAVDTHALLKKKQVFRFLCLPRLPRLPPSLLIFGRVACRIGCTSFASTPQSGR